LRTVVVDEQSSINVKQTAVITAQTEAPEAAGRQFDVPRELQPVTLRPHKRKEKKRKEKKRKEKKRKEKKRKEKKRKEKKRKEKRAKNRKMAPLGIRYREA